MRIRPVRATNSPGIYARSWLGTIAIASLLLTGALVTSAANPATAEARKCQAIKIDGKSYAFYKQSMRCKRAKRNARRVAKTRGNWEPKTFRCTSGSGFRNGGHCRHNHRNKLFGWHPFD
jgi:hypothetical protein